jgi:hypothetical protein
VENDGNCRQHSALEAPFISTLGAWRDGFLDDHAAEQSFTLQEFYARAGGVLLRQRQADFPGTCANGW